MKWGHSYNQDITTSPNYLLEKNLHVLVNYPWNFTLRLFQGVCSKEGFPQYRLQWSMNYYFSSRMHWDDAWLSRAINSNSGGRGVSRLNIHASYTSWAQLPLHCTLLYNIILTDCTELNWTSSPGSVARRFSLSANFRSFFKLQTSCGNWEIRLPYAYSSSTQWTCMWLCTYIWDHREQWWMKPMYT